MTLRDQFNPPPAEVYLAEPRGIGGWLLYLCIAFSILGPIKVLQWVQAASNPWMIALYLAIGITSFLAGVTTWAEAGVAFFFVRLAIGTRLGYAFYQVYFGLMLSHRGSAAAIQEFGYAAVNGVMVLLLFLYFRTSSRVANTFGRNF